jgi:hypothetical protein
MLRLTILYENQGFSPGVNLKRTFRRELNIEFSISPGFTKAEGKA